MEKCLLYTQLIFLQALKTVCRYGLQNMQCCHDYQYIMHIGANRKQNNSTAKVEFFD